MDCVNKTKVAINEHKEEVAIRIKNFIYELDQRARIHDESKFSCAEFPLYQKLQNIIEQEGIVSYGSEDYRKRINLIRPAVEHHYKMNRHHPEHFSGGIVGMNLIDLLEMLADWAAAAKRNKDGKINMTHNIKKYNVSPELESVLKNTLDFINEQYE